MEIVQLIERCRQGDANALNELYTTYASQMKMVCRRYLSDEQAIKDVTHDSFIIILTSLDKLRDDSKAVAWMMSITRNVASKYKEYQKKHPTIFLESVGTKEYLTKTTQENEEKNISLAEIMSIIDKLPDGYGQVFRLSVFEGLSHNEIAAKLGIAPHSSSSQLARAKSMLRQILRQYWPIVLLLLIPISFFLFKKENSAVIEEKTVVVHQEHTPRISPIEIKQEPLVEQKTTNHTTITTADTLQSAIVYTKDTIVLDTTAMLIVYDEKNILDTVCDNLQRDTMQFIQQTEIPQYDFADNFSEKSVRNSKNAQRWSIEFAYAGSFDEQNFDNLSITNASNDVKNALPSSVSDQDTILYKKNHYMPLTVTLAVHYKQSERFGFESGLSYIRLNSEFKNEINGNLNNDALQTVHYLGVPIKGTYTMLTSKRWNLYDNLGVMVGIPVHSQVSTNTHVSCLWSVSAGLGLQYNVTRNIGIFAEPSIQYYIQKKGGVVTYCTEHPFSFALPLGIKINL